MPLRLFAAVLTLFIAGACLPAMASDDEPLVDDTETVDYSRGFLFDFGESLIDPTYRGVGPSFVFPDDVKNYHTYGIDLSHHNFANGRTFPWSKMHESGIRFVYLKASQGKKFIDKTLVANWTKVGEASTPERQILRGAYHFLSADVDPTEQAKHFVKLMKNLGFDRQNDLPPCLDVEWDLGTTKSGKKVDRWLKYSPDDINEKVNSWISHVETELNVKVVLYTSASWWDSVNLSNNSNLTNRPIWIADYSNKSFRNSSPRKIPGVPFVIWQMTDNSRLGSTKDFDGNVAMMAWDDFISSMRPVK